MIGTLGSPGAGNRRAASAAAAPVDGAARGDERLADHLAAEHPLPADLRAAAAIQVVLELFEIEDGRRSSTARDMGGPAGGASVGDGGAAQACAECPAGQVKLDRREPARSLTPEEACPRPATAPIRIVIAGGGLAGLSLALALKRASAMRSR